MLDPLVAVPAPLFVVPEAHIQHLQLSTAHQQFATATTNPLHPGTHLAKPRARDLAPETSSVALLIQPVDKKPHHLK